MRIIFLQVLLLGFALVMIYSLFLHWRKKEISIGLFFFWLMIFFVFILLSIWYNFFESFVKELFFVRVMDLGVIGTFMILTYVSIENNVKVKILEKKIEKLVRKIILTKLKK